ncbi:glycoside hydrolase [Dysgonomonas sp. 216]|uniref:glycosyl hydrolase family 28 protein n=1 Tax=Dysgonomonas sp. 216 TaxID=2302934 RepID=UPI0013D32D12|nr:glycosyl hydrolase family 28 protein [Dysgonomonas sp. 216]NDW17761.1 glycoside hydrolase [Dysgonomonas sp. 216]
MTGILNIRGIFLFVICFFLSQGLLAEIITYPIPAELYYARHNDDFTVKVREKGGKWVDLFEYTVKVDMDTQSEASMAYFDFSGTVEVRVQKNNGELNSAIISPLSKGIVPEIDGNVISFTIDKPQNLSIECNGNRLNNLHLFAGDIDTNKPDKNDPNVIYFEAGYHKPTDSINKVFNIPSNSTVYLEGGAVLAGKLNCHKVENVKICGRGILLEPTQAISVDFSNNITIDGIIALNPRYYTVSGGQSTNITISNLKSFSYQGWSDGLDFMSCRDVVIDNVFMRNSDDCIAIYNHRWDFWGDSRNFLIQNSTLWADVAHPINIGTHGNTETGDEVMENIVFRNIDILEHDEDDPDYQGCMAVNVGDYNTARNILFEDIRVESIQEGQLFHLRVMYNKKYNTGEGKGIEDITFRNIYYNGKNENSALTEGYAPDRMIKNITFENIVINGIRAKSLDELNMNRGKYTKDIRVK